MTDLPPPPAVSRGSRKTITVVFADLVGSTELGGERDPETVRPIIDRYFEVARGSLEAHGGTVEKFIGDAVMAVFGIPTVREDDALRAVRAAADLLAGVERLNLALEAEYGVRLAVRIGVDTGEVLAQADAEGQRYATGDVVNVAARLQQVADSGEALLSQATHALVRHAVDVDERTGLILRGKAQPTSGFSLRRVLAGAEGHLRRRGASLVGREDEIELLRGAFARSIRERRCHLYTVLGSPGVGKSRLVAEFVAVVGGHARIAMGRCLPYGDGITFWPVYEALVSALELPEGAAATTVDRHLTDLLRSQPDGELAARHASAALGLSEGSISANESLWALRRCFEAIAESDALVLVFDDIQWGQPTFLDFIEHLADWSREVPLILVCMARPDLLDVRPTWAGGKVNATTVMIEPLSAESSDVLLSRLLDGGDLEPAARQRIEQSAGGNPLFMEEMVAMLVEDGTIRREEGRWVTATDLDGFRVPATIRALLAARLDQLETDERTVVELGSVEGQVFHRGGVLALADDTDRDGLAAAILELNRRDVVKPERSLFPGDAAFRFRHLLIRDAAYEAVPKERRADLHARFADWLASVAPEADSFAEIIGYHLEAALRYRSEVRPGDRQEALAERAGSCFAVAGRRAYARGDLPAAKNLLGRASTLLPPEHVERVPILPMLASAVAETGDVTRARVVLAEAVRAGVAAGDRVTEWRARVLEGWWQQNTEQAPLDEIRALVDQAIQELEALGDDLGLAYAWRLRSDISNWMGRGFEWANEVHRAYEHARRAGDRPEAYLTLNMWGGAMFFGRTASDDAIEQLTRARAEVDGDILLEAAVERPLGGFLALSGRRDEGWTLIERARRILAEFGLQWASAGIGFVAGRISVCSGDFERAYEEYRVGAEILRRMHERGRLSSLVTELACVTLELGRTQEAERLLAEAEDIMAEGDVQPQAGTRRVRARLMATRGDAAAAVEVARSAVAMLVDTDFLDDLALTAMDFATVLSAAGRRDEALAELHRAGELARRRKNVLLEEQVENRLASLATTPK